MNAVDREITDLAVEHDKDGNRAKAYLYCIEATCPQTGWAVPLLGTRLISLKYRTTVELVPDHSRMRFDLRVSTDADESQLNAAKTGTVVDGDLVYELNGEAYRTPIKTLRGDFRLANGIAGNRLRRWEKDEFMPRAEDVFQERLYAIQWVKKESLGKKTRETFFASVTEADLERERRVEQIVSENLSIWQDDGLVPDMPIEPGDKTDEPIRTRGWTHWHHLFAPRALLRLALTRKHGNSPINLFELARGADRLAKLCRFNANPQPSQGPKIEQVFSNQALNTLVNYGVYSFFGLEDFLSGISASEISLEEAEILSAPAKEIAEDNDIYLTDPPYADAVNYHEITEFFIAWLRKNPPSEFADWIWDSRRPLAIKGSGEDFRREMVAAYGAMAKHMPDNGLQIVMFTHQDTGVWSDMASIVWGAGLQVTAAWYIATETTSELKKGGYVQGTVLLILRKRLKDNSVYRDELAGEIRLEVAKQIETMVGLNQETIGMGRSENLFEDNDFQMAGNAAALRVLTGYRRIDGQDMVAEALRPRQKGERDVAKEMIDYAVTVANEHLVPEGLSAGVFSRWKQTADVLPILTGEKEIRDEVEAWNLIRNPLPPRSEGHLFDHIRSDLQLRKDQHYSDRPVTDLDEFTRSELQEEITQRRDSLSFFQRNNPILRHTVLRKRATLEELGLLDKIAVDIWPGDNEMLSVFDGIALRTSAEFDAAYEAANAFAAALAKRTQAAGFMKTMMQSRICSSIASGLATAEKLLKKKIQLDEEDEEAALLFDRVPDIIDEERFYLDRIVHFLKQRPTDPKLDAVVHFLNCSRLA